MGKKVKIDAGGDYSSVDPSEGFETYTGETPGSLVARLRVDSWFITKNAKGDKMFKVVFKIAFPSDNKKSKYNGYTIWHNANITKVGAPYMNSMLDALGIERSDVWRANMIQSDEPSKMKGVNKTYKIERIGRINPEGLLVWAKLDYDEDYNSHGIGTNSWVADPDNKPIKSSGSDDEDTVDTAPLEDDDDDAAEAAAIAKAAKKAKKAAAAAKALAAEVVESGADNADDLEDEAPAKPAKVKKAKPAKEPANAF